MIKERFGEKLDGIVHQFFPFLFRRAVNPNLLTMVGVGLSLVAAAFLATGSFVVGGVVLLVGGFFDMADGTVARHFGLTTPYGAFLDSSMDRFVDMLLLLALIFYYGGEGQKWVVLLASVVLVGSVMTSYTKARAEAYVPSLKNGVFERGERIFLLGLGAVSGWMIPVLGILFVGTTYTTIQRFVIAHRELNREPVLREFDSDVSNVSGENH